MQFLMYIMVVVMMVVSRTMIIKHSSRMAVQQMISDRSVCSDKDRSDSDCSRKTCW